jgi:hypothetical protein
MRKNLMKLKIHLKNKLVNYFIGVVLAQLEEKQIHILKSIHIKNSKRVLPLG